MVARIGERTAMIWATMLTVVGLVLAILAPTPRISAWTLNLRVDRQKREHVRSIRETPFGFESV